MAKKNENAISENAISENAKKADAKKGSKRRLAPASHLQVAVRAFDAIIDFDLAKFENEAGYTPQLATEEQIAAICDLREKTSDLRAQFGGVKSPKAKTPEQIEAEIAKLQERLAKMQ